jgi:hypothetical protein
MHQAIAIRLKIICHRLTLHAPRRSPEAG